MSTEAQTCTIGTCSIVAINNAGLPRLKWRDTIHASRDTNDYAKQTQFPKQQNERKLCLYNELRTKNYEQCQ